MALPPDVERQFPELAVRFQSIWSGLTPTNVGIDALPKLALPEMLNTNKSLGPPEILGELALLLENEVRLMTFIPPLPTILLENICVGASAAAAVDNARASASAWTARLGLTGTIVGLGLLLPPIVSWLPEAAPLTLYISGVPFVLLHVPGVEHWLLPEPVATVPLPIKIRPTTGPLLMLND